MGLNLGLYSDRSANDRTMAWPLKTMLITVRVCQMIIICNFTHDSAAVCDCVTEQIGSTHEHILYPPYTALCV